MKNGWSFHSYVGTFFGRTLRISELIFFKESLERDGQSSGETARFVRLAALGHRGNPPGEPREPRKRWVFEIRQFLWSFSGVECWCHKQRRCSSWWLKQVFPRRVFFLFYLKVEHNSNSASSCSFSFPAKLSLKERCTSISKHIKNTPWVRTFIDVLFPLVDS